MGECGSRSGRDGKEKNLPLAGLGPALDRTFILEDHWFECRPAHWLSTVGEEWGASGVTAPGSKVNILNTKKLCSTNYGFVMKKPNQQTHIQICRFIVLYTAFWGLGCL